MLKRYLFLFILPFTFACNNEEKPSTDMTWSTLKTEHEGFSLYLRKPNYSNIWEYKAKYPKLLCVTHTFDEVKDNGLPKGDYNLSLADFDDKMCSLFQSTNEGIIFLIETYGGERNYYYYISPEINFEEKVNAAKKQFNIDKLETNSKDDKDWGFLDKYPTKLYDK